LIVIRPADANETAAAWRIAIREREHPVALILSRQNLPVLDLGRYPQLIEGVPRGGYVLERAADDAHPQAILIATGSEVSLALAAREQLARQSIDVRVVSMPSWNLFERQPAEYRERVVPPGARLLAIEAGVSLGWRPYVGPQIAVIGVDRYGASAPGKLVMEKYGFNVDNVVARVRELLG